MTESNCCEALWCDESIKVGDELRAAYRGRIASENLSELAASAHLAKGEPGGQSDDDTDKHFAWRFPNSAGRSIYVCLDPKQALGSVSVDVRSAFLDGDIVVVDVPCGGGAGILGLLSAIYEQRKAALLPTLPLNVTLIAGDYSPRARTHMRAMVELLRDAFLSQQISLVVEDVHWNALDVRSSAQLVDLAVERAKSADRAFLLVSNFSAALLDKDLRAAFEHFLSQFSSRIQAYPHIVCWVEPNSKDAMALLPGFDSWITKLLSWFKTAEGGRVANTGYKMCDPLTGKVYPTGVTVLKCTTEGLPW